MRHAIVVVGMNAVECDCREGTVFIPVNMRLMAKLLHGGASVEFVGRCHLGHTQKIIIRAGNKFLQ